MLIIDGGTVKDEEQWTKNNDNLDAKDATSRRQQHTYNKYKDEMIEEEKEEEMTNDGMIDSLTSLLNYWSYREELS